MKLILCEPNLAPRVVELPEEHEYTDLLALLGIEGPLTCVTRSIGGEPYDLWLDDMGLLREDKFVSGACLNASEILCGNILIAKHDGAGNTIGLTDGEIDSVFKAENWGINSDFMSSPFGKGFRRDRDGNLVAYEDYGGFGRVLMHPKGALLFYEA